MTNALRETLLSFGGTVTAELLEQLEAGRRETALSPAARPYEPASGRGPDLDLHKKPASSAPPVARTHPMPASRPVATPVTVPAAVVAPAPPAPAPAPAATAPVPAPPAPKPNVSVVLQPLVTPLYAPRAPAPLAPAGHYFEVGGAPWPFYHEDVPRAARPDCWVKPTIFYDGFWTEHKVKKWVAEQVDRRLPPAHLAHLPHLAAHLPHLQPHPHYSHHTDAARG